MELGLHLRCQPDPAVKTLELAVKSAGIDDGAWLVNEAGGQEANGDGYYIRDDVIVVPKDGVTREGTRV